MIGGNKNDDLKDNLRRYLFLVQGYFKLARTSFKRNSAFYNIRGIIC